jgi:hypothetical protein
MTTITLYKPNATLQYKDASGIRVESGVLTFNWKKDAAAYRGTKFTTTLPFLIEEDDK